MLAASLGMQMKKDNVYETLARHLSSLSMGIPFKKGLGDILRENLTEKEAAAALILPATVIPLKVTSIDTLDPPDGMTRSEMHRHLKNLSDKGMVVSGETDDGSVGYALLHVGFGFPQTFFWKGEDTPHARKMAKMVAKYFNSKLSREIHDTDPKAYRYIPVGKTVRNAPQGVLPFNLMEKVIEDTQVIALGHCPCRVGFTLAGRGCDHPTEVCMKFNDMARFVIDKGFAREITKIEALEVIKLAEEKGLVHFVDNAEGEIQHNCNCCGCACWNVGAIRRRSIPRDSLMATYFIRAMGVDECIGCGACADICPVDAVVMSADDVPETDNDWCIGCGVCATVCPTDAIEMVYREDKLQGLPPRTFGDLHELISTYRKKKDKPE